MRVIFLTLLVVTLVSLSWTPHTSAHVPIVPSDGDSLETAIEIENPTKSWVIYSHLHEAQEAKYFSFEISKDERIRLMLSIPIYESSPFSPELVLMGPGIVTNGTLPAYVDHPNATGISIFQSESRDPEYEGFTPTSFYRLVDIDISAPEAGQYYVAIYDQNSSGSISLAVGYRETFTLEEWILVPISVIGIHQWNGQSLLMILLPVITTLILGMVYSGRKEGFYQDRDVVHFLGSISAWLFIASGISIYYQMTMALLSSSLSFQIAVTAIFGLIPILLGIYVLGLLSQKEKKNAKEITWRLLFVSIIALFTWSGLIIGSVMLAISGLGHYLTNRNQIQAQI